MQISSSHSRLTGNSNFQSYLTGFFKFSVLPDANIDPQSIHIDPQPIHTDPQLLVSTIRNTDPQLFFSTIRNTDLQIQSYVKVLYYANKQSGHEKRIPRRPASFSSCALIGGRGLTNIKSIGEDDLEPPATHRLYPPWWSPADSFHSLLAMIVRIRIQPDSGMRAGVGSGST